MCLAPGISGFTLAGEHREGSIFADISVSDQGNDAMHRLPANLSQVAAMSGESSTLVVVRRQGKTDMQLAPPAVAPPSDQLVQSQDLFVSHDKPMNDNDSDDAMVCSLPPGQGEPASQHLASSQDSLDITMSPVLGGGCTHWEQPSQGHARPSHTT